MSDTYWSKVNVLPILSVTSMQSTIHRREAVLLSPTVSASLGSSGYLLDTAKNAISTVIVAPVILLLLALPVQLELQGVLVPITRPILNFRPGYRRLLLLLLAMSGASM